MRRELLQIKLVAVRVECGLKMLKCCFICAGSALRPLPSALLFIDLWAGWVFVLHCPLLISQQSSCLITAAANCIIPQNTSCHQLTEALSYDR